MDVWRHVVALVQFLCCFCVALIQIKTKKNTHTQYCMETTSWDIVDALVFCDVLQRRFWEEYVRESSPSGGLETVVGGIHSLYVIVPLVLVVLIIAGVAIAVWRCHSRKRTQRSPSQGHSHHDQVLSVVSMDHWGRDYPHGDQTELSIHSSPAYAASELASVRGGAGDPPPSYEEAVGHTDVHIETEPPPQYEDIVNNSSTSVNAGK